MNKHPEFRLRALSTPDDYAQCVRLQRVTWGEEFTEVVSPVILMLTQKVGGIAAGAFTDDGQLAGYVYGLTGFYDGEPVHWSHMLAVEPEFEGLGIGRKLKEFQRQRLLERGIKLVRWTFDPLVARNAHLNYNRLGAVATEYVPNMYGTDTGSVLHSGLGTDRLVVEWFLDGSDVESALSGTLQSIDSRVSEAPVVNTTFVDGEVNPVEPELPPAAVVKIEIPSDIDQIKAESMELGSRWRESTKRACLWYLERDYVIEGFYRDANTNRSFYFLSQCQGAKS